MASLQWHPASSDNTHHAAPQAVSSVPENNIWFSVSLGLMGIIVGFGIGQWRQLSSPSISTSQPTALAAAAVAPTLAAPSALTVPPVDLAKDHIRGSKDASVAVIEYTDFECPFCKRVHPTYQQIMQQYNGKVMWVMRHFPLSFHQNAQKEAEATECAAELGGNDAFWKFTDGIFEKTTSNGTGFPLDQLPVLAKQIGLNERQFTACLDSGKYAAKVKKDEDDGSAGGVTGTPGNFVVNLKTKTAQPLVGAVPFTNFKSAIDAQIP